MTYAAIAFAAAALSLAGTAVALALRIGGLKDERGGLLLKLKDTEAENERALSELIRANKQLSIRDQLLLDHEDEIKDLRDLLRRTNADGVAADLFDRLLPPR